ncbi:MAG: S4 domain-containing protein YaaA [Clostridium sp.]|jgi:ribosome-associated protein|uniref:S4 domain-containing protein YaaA n=1 Tax=Clostridium sp. TaxID=1506 RepID=UPI002671E44C|nr:S4 domain-containing protein YaaA [Clostridium sp.]MCI7030133.1 S4 domain-containing protein YaaA [Clostridium sp.]MDD7682452.1 S4 domain-containing protein YaaA [Clostridium sp.]MDY2580478.1 S4 domain-containing protein YaaA [Clostridium sp.]
MEVKIQTEFIKLDSFLKFCGAASLGSEAKMYILDELVKVNGEICTQRGKKLYRGDIVEFNGETFKVV